MPGDSTERWLPVVGWEGVYDVSDLGRVRRVGAHQKSRWAVGRVLTGNGNRQGYLTAGLSLGPRRRTYMVHRLVMEAFAGPCAEGHEVNHINGVKTDNRVVNLEYVTPAENMRHAARIGLRRYRTGADHRNTIHSDAVVAGWRDAYRQGATLPQLAREAGTDTGTVSKAVSGQRRAAVTLAPPEPIRPQAVGDADSQMRYPDAAARAWRSLYAQGVRCAVIARAYDTTTQAVWQIVTGKRRRHLR